MEIKISPCSTQSTEAPSNSKYQAWSDEAPAIERFSNFQFIKKAYEKRNNVFYTLSFVFLGALFRSITSWNLFDAYLSIIARSRGYVHFNTWVGLAESLSGLGTFIFAVPCAYFADSYDRAKLSHLTAYLGIIASAIQIYCFYSDSVQFIYCNLFLWGVIAALQSTAVYACLADSLPESERLTCMTLMGMSAMIAQIMGPTISICMFAFLGNTWTLRDTRVPLLAGSLFGPAAYACLLCLKPEHMLPNKSIQVKNLNPVSPQSTSASTLSTETFEILEKPLLVDVEAPLPENSFPKNHLPENLNVVSSEKSFDTDVKPQEMSRAQRAVPYLLTIAMLIGAMGAGMTVRFFTLFFINDYQFRPTGICALYIVIYLLQTLVFSVSQELCHLIGRVNAAFVSQVIGIILLYVLSSLQSWQLVVFVFIARSVLANAPGPINRSILLDYVDSKDRGKWGLADCIASGLWSMSALWGSHLADTRDYRYTFKLTAFVYVIDAIVYLPLLFIVKNPGSTLDETRSMRT